MSETIKCDGETIFGFTVKACNKPATRLNVRNGTHEYYDFCEEHYDHYLHGNTKLADHADPAPSSASDEEE